MKDTKFSLMQRFGWSLFFWDLIVVAAVMVINAFVHFWALPNANATFKPEKLLTLSLNPVALSLSMFLLWILALVLIKSWNPRVAGTGIPEYIMTTKASVAVVAVLAFASLTFKVDVSRTFVFSSFATGAIALAMHRWSGRQWLLRQRRQGAYVKRTLLVGPPEQLLEMCKRLQENPLDGYAPVRAAVFRAAFTGKTEAQFAELGVDLVVYEESSAEDAQTYKIDCVLIIGSDHMSAARLKQIGWALEGTTTELIVAPALVDFAGNRINSYPVAGMPFLHIETPRFEGFKYLVKTTFDFLFAAVAFVAVLPIMLVTAISIKLEDGGPIFYAQERVGQNGNAFKMFKFRSMLINADSMHAELRAKAVDAVNKRMFKDPNDPRLTKVGKFIRRFSIDELPQIFNVMNGSMSVVGPRPPLASEVAEYDRHDHRRLLVKPGITGLWQVSGRSLLSWDETVRLDLYYVENWSLVGDILIILRTFKAVVDRSGAY